MSPAWWLVAALVVALFLVARRLNGARARDARSGARLAGVLEGVSAGLSVWSPEQQLVACNSRFREFYPGVELKPGLVFEDLLRYTATRGVVRLDEREIASWVTDRVSRFSEAGVDVRRSADGGWLEMRCVTTGQGEVVMLYTDVTEVRDAARSHERDDERRKPRFGRTTSRASGRRDRTERPVVRRCPPPGAGARLRLHRLDSRSCVSVRVGRAGVAGIDRHLASCRR